MSKEIKEEISTDDIWKDVCTKVVEDAVFDKTCITDTVDYLKSKYKIELINNTK